MAITFGQHHQHTNIVADGQQQPWTVAVPVANGESAAAATAAMMMGDYFEENGKLRKARGLSWAVAAFFVVADMAGGGIVALPTAVVRCQFYPGLFLLLFMAFISIFSAMKLSKCWEILLRRFPTYRTHCRKPYAEIGFRALGPKMKTIVSICVNIDMFGSSTIFLLLCTKNIRDFLQAFYRLDISFCWLILVIALFLWPITLLKSPKDFWPVIVGGMLSTGFAIILVCLGALLDYGTCQPVREFPEFSAVNYLYALGTMLFTYGGQSTFPTIQHDMKKPAQFAKSVVLGYITISVFNFLAVSIGGFVYGNSLRDSVINSVQIVWIQQMINLMITAHCLLTLSLIINPLDQEIEELVGIPQHFGWKRVLVRSAVLATIVFVAETVPSFGPVLDFFGGSAMALNSFVFPSVFYLFLAAGEQKAKEKEHYGCVEPPTFREMVQRTKKRTLILCGVVIVLSTLAGFIATFFASRAMISSEFTTPCYMRTFFGSQMNTTTTTTTATNCCGPYQNVSRYGPSQQQCAKMDLNFF